MEIRSAIHRTASIAQLFGGSWSGWQPAVAAYQPDQTLQVRRHDRVGLDQRDSLADPAVDRLDALARGARRRRPPAQVERLSGGGQLDGHDSLDVAKHAQEL